MSITGNRFVAPTGAITALNLSQRFLLIAIALSPFQKTLTISVGFPLKLSELAILAALATAPFVKSPKLYTFSVEKTLTGVLALFAALSTAAALIMPVPTGPFSGVNRSLTVDVLLYLVYSLMVLFGWFLMVNLPAERIRKAVGIAVRLCAIFCIIQYVLWTLGAYDIIRALGYEMVFGSSFGEPIPRNGPFMEGNYLGFFGGVGLFIAARQRDKLGVLAGVFCLVYSQSTNALLAVVAGIIITFLLRPQVRWASILGAFGLLVALAIALVPRVQSYLFFQLSKLGVVSAQGAADVDRSIGLRTGKTQTGLDMAFANPIFGVGPGRFGVWFNEFADPSLYPDDYLPLKGRAITENAYIQMGSELGLIALAVFALLLLAHTFRVFRSYRVDFALAVFVIIALNAAPSWTTITIWMALAYLGAAARDTPDLEPAKQQKLSKADKNRNRYRSPRTSGAVRVPQSSTRALSRRS